jgi:glycosyltransferase involved in cell wall biosynthesis
MKITKCPVVCICVPTYNAETTLRDSLESILSQTYLNIKVFVVDNASQDNTVKIADDFASRDDRLKVFKHKTNVGMYSNFDRCIELSIGDYTALYHSDDIYCPNIVQVEVDFLEKNKTVGAVLSSAYEIDKNGKIIGYRKVPKELLRTNKKIYSFENIFKSVLMNGNFLICPSAMVRTEIYKNEIKTWEREKHKTSADLDVWLRISENHPIGIINKFLVKYRVSQSSFSYTYTRLRLARHDLFSVLKDYVKKYEAMLTKGDLTNYDLLFLKDDINIAINQIIRGENLEARKLLRDIFHIDNILNSFRRSGQLKILLIGYVAWVLSVFELPKKLRVLIAKIRHKG